MAHKPKNVSPSGMRITPLSDLKRHKDIISSPFSKLGNMSFSSWVHEVLADSLWSVLIVGGLNREKALSAFRVVIQLCGENKEGTGKIMLVHSQLKGVPYEIFEKIFAPLCEDDETKKCLSPLLLLKTLPDRDHWLKLLGPAPEWTDAGEKLATAIAKSFDHQSQEATDCRWVRVMTLIAQDRLMIDQSMAERFQEIVGYPAIGEMKSVRPSIRAMEMATRNSGLSKEAPPPWAEEFWQECWQSSHCMPAMEDDKSIYQDYKYLFEQVVELHENLNRHFIESIQTTAVDARHDGCFGITFYVIHLLCYSIKSIIGQSVVSRTVLRSAVESYITLSYLSEKDDKTVWLQYRNYGYSQTKLSLLKNISLGDIPSFLTIEMLEAIANEDMWIEYQDIKLGAWADKNLRKMADEANVKDTYDKYYDALSGYVHGNWMAVRHSVFVQCLNPLHRFHRIPVPPRQFGQDAIPDLVKIANLCLDRVTKLYPPFKPRFRLNKARTSDEKPEATKT